MSIEAMKQALEALYLANTREWPENKIGAAINALSYAIEQAEKPTAWMYDFLSDNEVIRDWMTQDYADIKRENGFNVRPLYAAPRQWVGLTNKDIIEMWPETSTVGWDDIRLIEAKLKEKNA